LLQVATFVLACVALAIALVSLNKNGNNAASTGTPGASIGESASANAGWQRELEWPRGNITLLQEELANLTNCTF
jgi:hypothetical protein